MQGQKRISFGMIFSKMGKFLMLEKVPNQKFNSSFEQKLKLNRTQDYVTLK